MIASCEFRRSPGALASASSGLYSLTGLEVNGNSFFQRPDSPIVPLALQAAATSFYRRSSASPTSPITSTPSASMRRAVSAGVNAQLSVAAPPQIEQGFLDANKMVVVAPQPSGYLQRRNSSGSIKSKTRSHEHLDSEGRVAALEEKVRELEAVIGTPSASLTIPINGTLKGSYSYPRIQYAQLMSLSSFDGGRMAQELLDKDSEIDRLRHQLHKYNSRLEMRQIQFDEEVKHYRREAEQSKLQAAAVKSRLNEIEQECNILQDKVGHSERQRQISLTKAEERLAAQEKELQSLRQELEKASSAKNELDQLRRDLEWMELQNDALSTTLDCKEQEVQDLRTDILNKSSVADAIASESSTSFTSLRDSQSTPSLSNVSRLLEAQQSKVANCRYTVKCLVDTADKLCKGELPNINRLLGCPSESMSESEAEKGRNGELTSMKAVEGQMRQQDAKIAAVERDLDRLRQVFVDF
uniref:Uncharacterized protein n=1 Tax=Plectus sambesii TaxID=2011161 RepID=A0A914XTT5_9BILA